MKSIECNNLETFEIELNKVKKTVDITACASMLLTYSFLKSWGQNIEPFSDVLIDHIIKSQNLVATFFDRSKPKKRIS